MYLVEVSVFFFWLPMLPANFTRMCCYTKFLTSIVWILLFSFQYVELQYLVVHFKLARALEKESPLVMAKRQLKAFLKVPHLLEVVLHRVPNLLWWAQQMVFCRQEEEFSPVSRVLGKALVVLLLARRRPNFNGNPKLTRTKESRIITVEVMDIRMHNQVTDWQEVKKGTITFELKQVVEHSFYCRQSVFFSYTV